MSNIGITRPRKIDLVQIEKGIEIYNTLLELKQIVDALKSSSQNIISSEHIYLENISDKQKLKIHDSWQQEFRENIFNDLISGKISGVKTIEDILVKLNSLEKGYSNINGTITNIESIIRRICEEEAYNAVQTELAALQLTINDGIENAKLEILNELSESFNQNISEIKGTIGELSNLHPYIGDALGDNNKTVKDAINFLFQLIVDLNENINLVNNKHGDNRAQLVNSYNVELPDPFILPADLGKAATKKVEKQDKENEMDLKSIADQIKYRKTLNKIMDDGWDGEE